jgi:hypothetical protein
MVWLVAGLPLATVFAGIALVAIALDPRGVDPGERVRRVAQVQQSDLAPDLAAARLSLDASLGIDRQTGRIDVALGSVDDRAWTLTLAHPGDARLDRRIELAGAGGRLAATTSPLDGGAWIATLESRDGALRIAGRVPAGASTTRLLPRVGR